MAAQFDLIRKLANIRDRLQSERPAQLLTMSADLSALIKLRVQTGGGKPQSGIYGPYSPNYARRRKKAGFQTDYVDFTRTGRMWASVVPVIVSNDEGVGVVRLIPSDQLSRNKMAGQLRKYGNILRPSSKEIDFAKTARIRAVSKIIREELNR